MPDPNEADEAADPFSLEGVDHGRTYLPEPEKRVIDPDSGPGHYAEASRYARRAAAALDNGEVTHAQVLAAIGQIHALLAVAAAQD